jgi:hypothetical protein
MSFQVLTARSMKMTFYGILLSVVSYKYNDVSDVLTASIIRVITLHYTV